MITRREFLDTLAVGSAGLAIGSHRQELCPDHGRQRAPQLRRHRPERPRVRSSFGAQGQQEPLPASPRCAMWRATFWRSSPALLRRRWATRPKPGKRLSQASSNSKDVDAITIATPDHWHTPMAICGLAGRQTRLCREAVQPQSRRRRAARARRNKSTASWCRWATQQRSSPHTIEIVEKIHGGLIGRAYFAKGLVHQHRKVDRHRQGRARSRNP